MKPVRRSGIGSEHEWQQGDAEMTDNTGSSSSDKSEGDGSADVSPEVVALEADISRTREDLAQTVDQLAAKLDVKSRVRARMSGAKAEATRQLRTLRDRATDAQGKPSTMTLGIGGGVVGAAAAVLAVALWRRSRPSRRRRRWR
jgi:uncharacterized protein with LGFP repeats